MMVLKSLLLAGFMLASALAQSEIKPSMATLQVQSNFDFSLTRKEFRVHYSGLGEEFQGSSDQVTIKIYKGDTDALHTFDVTDKNTKKIYHFALEEATEGVYKVEVCVGTTCSGKNPALTEIPPVSSQKITCERVTWNNDKLEDSAETYSETFVGPDAQDWIAPQDFTEIEKVVNTALKDAKKPEDYETDYKKLRLTANPQYKHDEKVFYAGLNFDIKRYKKLFDKLRSPKGTQGTEYAHEYCERKYLLSAHAHIVDVNTKEVKHRFKTTLFLSEGGKQLYILGNEGNRKVHVELSHKGEEIDAGDYHLWITFCATEKDAIESTFCADPIIKKDFNVVHTN